VLIYPFFLGNNSKRRFLWCRNWPSNLQRDRSLSYGREWPHICRVGVKTKS